MTLTKTLDHLDKFRALNGKRILLVDDEKFCLKTVKMMLAKAGIDIRHQVDTCIDGQEMLD